MKSSLRMKGFEWIEHADYRNSVLSYIRKGKSKNDFVIVLNNFTAR